MRCIYRDITYPSAGNMPPIGSCSIEPVHGKGYQPAEDIPYTDEELELLDTEKKTGVLYFEVR